MHLFCAVRQMSQDCQWRITLCASLRAWFMGRRRCRCAHEALTFSSEMLHLWSRMFSSFFFLCICIFPMQATVVITPVLEGISHPQDLQAAPHASSCIHQKSPELVKSNPNVNVCAGMIFFHIGAEIDVLATLWKHQEKRLKQKKPTHLWEPDGLLSCCVSRVFGPRWSSQSGTALRTLA